MRYIAFLLFALLTVCCVILLGCNAENPICSDNFCAIGEVFPRADLDDTQPFSEIDVDDSVIFATLIGGVKPVETAPIASEVVKPKPPQTIPPSADSVSLADIVADVESGSTRYLNQTVTITGTVRTPNSVFQSGAITLITDTSTSFFITDRANPERMNAYQRGKTYAFTVHIRKIDPPDDEFDNYAVFSNLENADTANPITPQPAQASTLINIIHDAATGSKKYLHKTVTVTGYVVWKSDKRDSILIYPTNSKDTASAEGAYFFIYSLDNPVPLNRYSVGNQYTFTVRVILISPPKKAGDAYGIAATLTG